MRGTNRVIELDLRPTPPSFRAQKHHAIATVRSRPPDNPTDRETRFTMDGPDHGTTAEDGSPSVDGGARENGGEHEQGGATQNQKKARRRAVNGKFAA